MRILKGSISVFGVFEAFADVEQLFSAFRAAFGVFERKTRERVEHDAGDDQSCILLVIRRNCVPGRIRGAGFLEAQLIGVHILVPEFALFEVGGTELPVLVGVVDPFEKALALLFLGQVQVELDDTGTVAVQMPFVIDYRPVTMLPYLAVMGEIVRNVLHFENLGMHPHDEHLFVV